jgi:MAF protein
LSNATLILASASPRRRELLAALGMPFDVHPADIDERASERDPARLAEGLALRKARATAEAERAGARPVIGADTVVVLDGRVLGKPADADEATAMLSSLRGRTHEVVTGVAVLAGERAAADHARTLVTMRQYTEAEIEHYVASGAPFDKAGGYAIQDPQFAPVERCDGCECSVIGLPLWTVGRLLRTAAGIDVDEPAYDRCAACPLLRERT